MKNLRTKNRDGCNFLCHFLHRQIRSFNRETSCLEEFTVIEFVDIPAEFHG